MNSVMVGDNFLIDIAIPILLDIFGLIGCILLFSVRYLQSIKEIGHRVHLLPFQRLLYKGTRIYALFSGRVQKD